MKRMLCLLLVFLLILSEPISTLAYAEDLSSEKRYGYISVEYSDHVGSIERLSTMVNDNILYADALALGKRLGYQVANNDEYVVFANSEFNYHLPVGYVQFYFGKTNVDKSVGAVVINDYRSPAAPILDKNGVWVPLEYTLLMLNSEIMVVDKTAIITMPQLRVVDAFSYISHDQEQLIFQWGKDFGYDEAGMKNMAALSRIINLFNGLLSFDGASWVLAFQPVIGDSTSYDAKYGETLARLFCATSDKEVAAVRKQFSAAKDILSPNGKIGKLLNLTISNEDDIDALNSICEKYLREIEQGSNSASYMYNRTYNQLEKALNLNSGYARFGMDFQQVQADLADATSKIDCLLNIIEFVGYGIEFYNQDTFAVNALEEYLRTSGSLTAAPDASIETMRFYVERIKTNFAEYSTYRLFSNNLDSWLKSALGISELLGSAANIELIAWSLVSKFCPFISNRLSAADNFELSLYAMAFQFGMYSEFNSFKSKVFDIPEHISRYNLKKLASYGYSYLKCAYITREAAVASLQFLPSGAYETARDLIDYENGLNEQIAVFLVLLKSSANNDSSLGFLPEDNDEYIKQLKGSDKLCGIQIDDTSENQIISDTPSEGAPQFSGGTYQSKSNNANNNVVNRAFAAFSDDKFFFFDDMLWEGNADLSEVREIGLNNGSTISIDGDYVYFLQSGGGEIAKYDHTKEVTSLGIYERIPFGNHKAENLIVYKGWVYFINETPRSVFPGSIYRVKTDNSAEECIFSGKCSCFNIYKDHIYFNDSDNDYCIYRTDLDGSNPVKISNHGGTSIVIEDDWIYYLSALEIRSWKLDGTPIIPEGAISPGRIYKMKLDGTDDQLVRDGSAKSLNVYDGHLYFVCGEDGGTIHRITVSGTNDVCLSSRRNSDHICICNGIIFYKSYELFHMYLDGSEFSIPITDNTSTEVPSELSRTPDTEGKNLSEILLGSWIGKTISSEEYRFFSNGRYEWNTIVTHNDQIIFTDIIESGRFVITGEHTFDLYPDVEPSALQSFTSAIYDAQTDHIYIGGNNTFVRSDNESSIHGSDNSSHDAEPIAVEAAAYIHILEKIIDGWQYQYNDGYGMLYDLDNDGIRELIVLYDVSDDHSVHYSISGIRNGQVVPLKENEYVVTEVDGCNGRIGIVKYNGKIAFEVWRHDYGHGAVDYDEIHILANDTLAEVASFTREGVWSYSQSESPKVTDNKCTINGRNCTYDEYQRDLSAIEEVDMLYTYVWDEQSQPMNSGRPLQELLNALRSKEEDETSIFQRGIGVHEVQKTEQELLSISESYTGHTMKEHLYLDMDNNGTNELVGIYQDEQEKWYLWYCSSEGPSCDNTEENRVYCVDFAQWCWLSKVDVAGETHIALNYDTSAVGSDPNCLIYRLHNGSLVKVAEFCGNVRMNEDGKIALTLGSEVSIETGRVPGKTMYLYFDGTSYHYAA